MWSARVTLIVATSVLLAAGCTKSPAMNQFPEIPSDTKKQLSFVCTHESSRIPPQDPEAEQLYRHARWLVKRNALKQDPAAYPSIERLMRVATAYGHVRANIALRRMLDEGQARSDDTVNETIDLVQELIKRSIPAGYYDMGWYVEHGYGVNADQELAFKYYRKAADLGNPEGQYLVGSILNDKVKNGAEIADIGWSMVRCAAEQEHAKAAYELGNHLQAAHEYPEAMKFFQAAAAAGHSVSAHGLAEAFGRNQRDEIYNLGQAIDPDRQERYKKTSEFLSDYSYLNPKVPELDTIVPLPPAKLPTWDGKFKWLEEHKANVPPPLPTEERIAEMAKAKGLDPKTGRLAAAPK